MTAGLETFAKVRALHDGAATAGERAAAAVKMQTFARKAGLTVEQAVSKLDAEARAAAKPAPPPRNPFEELFKTPEFRAQKAEREARRATRRAEALARYGSEEAVWETCEIQRALEEACRPIITRKPVIGGEMDTLQGWSGGPDLPPAARAAISEGYPLPDTVHGVWTEYRYWDERCDEQEAFCPDIDHPLAVQARRHVLEELLDTLPARSLRDTRARLDWMQCVLDWGTSRDVSDDQACLTTLCNGIERMAERIRDQDAESASVRSGRPKDRDSPGSGSFTAAALNLSDGRVLNSSVQTGHDRLDVIRSAPCPLRRTNADKRRDVLALLGFSLSDREIARRAAVSPQTVGNIRRAS
ncbi:hypothetical protein OPKNFCMD_6593 [Methylobacterium crusticola]|uniref:Helix-turn-helix domain-containing protein n=1 Tax=Methylobacterium crusticola TaxID=1697972 RepID=A0ABQ4RAB5_9HYPH|nr:hypothetical protein [Methylobacterium crusticola]GJD53815.1 hypothetical protein OPKNFCMD_6593 [Methylobacterium crusticola]